ncbi:hypothetical protein QZN29_22320 [Burkholderia multivorans]|jgi:hypothetical protein|nr:hypothetical protein [Burkholderia multivorans]MCA8259349.1 hypothetical protein [Burkholderia multivorans]MCA8371998.1 hypothetical protein [Burkholderia multivorans]MCL4627752.1 hypothetical protein [Burkholderia multivorans]MCO1358302.1 hypothetical protein [Burkholderia multivorans]MCO1384663.1 hypothetical protein [Burkholderia multivorans]
MQQIDCFVPHSIWWRFQRFSYRTRYARPAHRCSGFDRCPFYFNKKSEVNHARTAYLVGGPDEYHDAIGRMRRRRRWNRQPGKQYSERRRGRHDNEPVAGAPVFGNVDRAAGRSGRVPAERQLYLFGLGLSGGRK